VAVSGQFLVAADKQEQVQQEGAVFACVDERAEGARTHARASRMLDEDVADDAVVAAGEPQDLGAALGRGGDSVRVDRSHGWILELARG